MGHLAAEPNELREAVSPGALGKGSPGTEAHSSAKGEEKGLSHPSYPVCLLPKGRKVLRARTKGRGHMGWCHQWWLQL